MATRDRPRSESDVDGLLAAVPAAVRAPSRRLLAAALDAFAERGYATTTTRDIAARAGMSPAAVYVHYASKEELLYIASRLGHEQVLGALQEAAAREEEPARRLGELVRTFVRWHATHHTVARIVQYELDALTAEHRAQVAAIRHEIERLVREAVDAGVRSGDFDVPDPAGATIAVLSLGVDVARWYRPGRWDPERIGDLHADLALRMLAAPPR